MPEDSLSELQWQTEQISRKRVLFEFEDEFIGTIDYGPSRLVGQLQLIFAVEVIYLVGVTVAAPLLE
jgi:hypothetical protein